MSNNSKLTKVLEHLTRGDEDAARDLLHQVFIDTARAIHEEMMNADDDMEQEVDENIGGTGDLGKDLTGEIKALEDEIDFEQTMSEDDEDIDVVSTDVVDDSDADDAMMAVDADMDATVDAEDGTISGAEEALGDLETALAALRAQFDKLENGDDSDMPSDDEVAVDDEVDAVDSEVDSEEVEDEVDESDDNWALDDEFDDLAESLDLEVVTKNMEKSVPAEDVGAASSGMSDGNNAKSVVPPSQTTRWGAKPVKTGEGSKPNGFKLETPPKSDKMSDMKSDNRRKKATDGTKKVSKDGATGALLNQNVPTDGKMSPLSKGGQNLKN